MSGARCSKSWGRDRPSVGRKSTKPKILYFSCLPKCHQVLGPIRGRGHRTNRSGSDRSLLCRRLSLDLAFSHCPRRGTRRRVRRTPPTPTGLLGNRLARIRGQTLGNIERELHSAPDLSVDCRPSGWGPRRAPEIPGRIRIGKQCSLHNKQPRRPNIRPMRGTIVFVGCRSKTK